MGRDTKVGLFVGLSFIVLFGVILSVRAGTQAEGHADLPLGTTQGIRLIGPGPVRRVDPTLERQVLELPLGGPARSASAAAEQGGPAAEARRAAADREADDFTDPSGREGVAVARRRRRPELDPSWGPSAPPPAPAPAAPAPVPEVEPEVVEPVRAVARAPVRGRRYTIREKDSLTVLSRRFYGSAQHWRRIFDANRGVIRDPDLLVVGKEIVIPEPPGGAPATDPGRRPSSPVPAPVPAPPSEPEPRDPPVISVTADQLAQVLGNHSDLVEAPAPNPSTYVVQPGDSFHRIAEKVYGDESLGRLLHLRNEHLVPDPLLLQAGQRILLLDGTASADQMGVIR